MKNILILILLIIPNILFSKCWGIYELRTTICAKVYILDNSKSCVKDAKLTSITIPKPHLQDLKKISYLKANSRITIQFSETRCKDISNGKEYVLLLEGLCDDKKGQDLGYNAFLARDSLIIETFLGHTNTRDEKFKVECRDGL